MGTTRVPISITRLTKSRADFETDAFEELVLQKGLRVQHEKNLACPCKDETSGQANVECVDCNGMGFLFKDPNIFRAVVQSVGFNNKGKAAGKLDDGNSSVTMVWTDRIAWMDKITVLDGEDVFYEIVYPKVRNIIAGGTECSALMTYVPLSVKDIHLYVDKSTPSVELVSGVDYTVNGRKITLSDDLRDNIGSVGKYNLSIRYTHNPQYLVNTINKNIRNTRVIQNGAVDTLKKMPLNFTMTKLHYILGDKGLNNFAENNI